jgi:ABC-type multidrug transport system fused ATPase/permease subunit
MRTVIYKKISRISPATNKGFQEGQIIELMSSDAQKAEEIFEMISGLCKIPTNTIYTFVMLLWYYQSSFLVSLVPFLFSFVSNRYFGTRRKIMQKQMKGLRDAKSNEINEILTNAKMLKLYGWQDQFKK